MQPRKTLYNEDRKSLDKSIFFSNIKNTGPSPSQLIEEKTRNILRVVNLCYHEGVRFTSLKPGRQTLVEVLETFLKRIDKDDDVRSMKNDKFAQIFLSLGYKALAINRNAFNPIGAPHTWNSVIEMLYWLSRIVEHRILQEDSETGIRAIIKQDETENKMLKSFFNDEEDCVELEQHLGSIQDEKRRACEDVVLKSRAIDLAIQNLMTSQKDIVYYEKELEQAKSLLFFEEQEVIKLDQENNQTEGLTTQNMGRIQDMQRVLQKENAEIRRLEDAIKAQELSATEAQQMRAQIQETELNIMKHGQVANEKKMQYDAQCQERLRKIMAIETSVEQYMVHQRLNQDLLRMLSTKIPAIAPLVNQIEKGLQYDRSLIIQQFNDPLNMMDLNSIRSQPLVEELTRFAGPELEKLRKFFLDMSAELKKNMNELQTQARKLRDHELGLDGKLTKEGNTGKQTQEQIRRTEEELRTLLEKLEQLAQDIQNVNDDAERAEKRLQETHGEGEHLEKEASQAMEDLTQLTVFAKEHQDQQARLWEQRKAAARKLKERAMEKLRASSAGLAKLHQRMLQQNPDLA